MGNVLELKQRASELKREAQSALKDCEAGTISHSELSEKMDKIEAEDKSIGEGITAYNRASVFRKGLADNTRENGLPPEAGIASVDPRVLQSKSNMEQYNQLVSKAKANLAHAGGGTGAFHFDMHLKGAVLNDDSGIHLKQAAQGIAGLQGEQTSGTTAPPTGPLAEDTYFYGGPAAPSITPTFIPGIVELRWYPNVIASLFPSFAVQTPIVSYVRETAWDNEAAPVKEGQQKPTSGNTLERFSANVGKLANLMRVTDEVIQDAPYFWSLVQRRGVQGISRKEEVELLAGSGLPGINGLLQLTAAQTGVSFPTGFMQAQTGLGARNVVIGGAPGAGASSSTISVTPGRAIAATDGTSIAEGMLDAIYDIRVNHFFEPDALVFNPIDWKTVRLAKSSTGQYLGGSYFGTNYGQPADAGGVGIFENLSLWGKRVVTTPAMPASYALAGDFADSSQILRLGGIRTDITNLNGYDFENNLWTMRVEERIGLMVERPELFELVSLTEGS